MLFNIEWLDYLKRLVCTQAVISSGSQFPLLNLKASPPTVTRDFFFPQHDLRQQYEVSFTHMCSKN